MGPAGMSVAATFWRRSTRKRTSRHQASLRVGSWEGCWMLGSAAVRFAMEGKGAVKDGGEDGGEGAF